MAAPALAVQVTDRDNPAKVTTFARWLSWTATSDMMAPADSFAVSLAGTNEQRALVAAAGAKVEIFTHGHLAMTGILDEVDEAANVGASDLQITGRDYGGILVDSAIPLRLLKVWNLNLRQIAERWTAPWRNLIKNVIVDNDANRYVLQGRSRQRQAEGRARLNVTDFTDNLGTDRRLVFEILKRPSISRSTGRFGKRSEVYTGLTEDRLNTKAKPGDKVFAKLQEFAEHIGVWAWMAANGDLILSRPNYNQSPDVYGSGIRMFWGQGPHPMLPGAAAEVNYATSIAERHSEYVVYGQGKANKTDMGRALTKRKWSVKDPGQAFWVRDADASPPLTKNRLYKPDVITVKNLKDERLTRRIARTTMERRALEGFELTYKVWGHRSPSGKLWAPDSIVTVNDDRHQLYGPFYITKRVFQFSEEGESTMLKLWPIGVWLSFDHDDLADDAAYEAAIMQKIYW